MPRAGVKPLTTPAALRRYAKETTLAHPPADREAFGRSFLSTLIEDTQVRWSLEHMRAAAEGIDQAIKEK